MGKKYEEFVGRIVKRHEHLPYLYQIELRDGKRMYLKLPQQDESLRIHEGTSIKVYGKKSFTKQKQKELKVV